jgi:hypothetical protein
VGGDPYLSGFEGQTSSVGGGRRHKTKKKSHHGLLGKIVHGPADLVGHLGHDVGDTASAVLTGVPVLAKAVAQPFEHPLRNDPTVKKQWSDLLHGHIIRSLHEAEKPGSSTSKVARLIDDQVKSYKDYYGHDLLHHLYQHPLQPLLDALTVASGGAGAVSKIARIADEESALARLTKPGETKLHGPNTRGRGDGHVLTRATSARPLRKAAQHLGDTLSKRTKYERAVIGELARYGRELRHAPDESARKVRLEAVTYTKAWVKLKANERVATAVMSRLPLPKHLDAWINDHLRPEAESGNASARLTLSLVTNPKVRELYEHPNERMLAAHAAADELGRRSAALAGMAPEAALTARYRHSRLVSGAKAYTPKLAKGTIRQLDRDARKLARTQAILEKRMATLKKRHTPEYNALRREASQTASDAARAAKVRQAPGYIGEQAVRAEERRANVAVARGSSLRVGLANRVTAKEQVLARAHDAYLNALTDPAGAKPALIAHRLQRVNEAESALEEARGKLRLARRAGQETVRAQENPMAALLRSGREPTRELPELLDEGAIAERQARELEALKHLRGDIASRITAGRVERDRLAELQRMTVEERDQIRPGIVGGPSIEDIASEISAAGRPQPIYLPDRAVAPTGKAARTPAARSALHEPTSPIRRSQGTLFLMGQLALEPDVLTGEFLRSVEYQHYLDLHDALLEAAVQVPRGHGLPAGTESDPYVWVSRGPAEPRPGHVESTKTAYRQSLHDLIPNVDDLGSSRLGDRLTTASESEAFVDGGNFRYAVPQSLAKRMSAEYQATRGVIARFFTRPMGVWRALVLGLKPAWLVGNIVGNHFLYALRNAGPEGIRAYLHMVYNSYGAQTVRRMLNMQSTPRGIRDEFMREFFPEQITGTFAGSQVPGDLKLFGRRVPAGGAAKVMSAGLIPADRAVEGGLRRAAVEASLRRAPEVKAILKSMPKEARDFREAASQALRGNPQLARRVSREVNDALGNFLDLSPFERDTVRSLAPFYAWYRAILVIALKLPLDSPVRTEIVAKLGQVGGAQRDKTLGPLETFLQTAIGIGAERNGRRRILNTASLNPFNTVAQETQAASFLTHPNQDAATELVGMTNPFLGSLIQSAGLAMAGDHRATGLLPGMERNVAEALPLVRLVHPHRSQHSIYAGSFLNDLLNYLGVPAKTLNTAEERRRAYEAQR